MKRSEVEVKAFAIIYHCDQCGEQMTRGSAQLLTNPIQFTWECNGCGVKEISREEPGIFYKVVENPESAEDL